MHNSLEKHLYGILPTSLHSNIIIITENIGMSPLKKKKREKKNIGMSPWIRLQLSLYPPTPRLGPWARQV